MNNYIILALCIGLAVGVVLTSAILVPYLKKKGVKPEQVLNDAEIAVNTTEKVVQTVSEVAPIPYMDIVKEVLKYAEIAVQKSEQLYKISQLSKEDRKQASIQYVYDILKLSDIKITPQLASVVDGAVEASVFALGK